MLKNPEDKAEDDIQSNFVSYIVSRFYEFYKKIFKILLRLIKMGYQVRVGVLQAGHYVNYLKFQK